MTMRTSRALGFMPLLSDLIGFLWLIAARSGLIMNGTQAGQGTVRSMRSLFYNGGRVLGMSGGLNDTLVQIGDDRRLKRRLSRESSDGMDAIVSSRILIIWAGADRVAFSSNAQAFADLIGRDVCRLIVVDGAGHVDLLHPEFSHIYISSICEFLSKDKRHPKHGNTSTTT